MEGEFGLLSRTELLELGLGKNPPPDKHSRSRRSIVTSSVSGLFDLRSLRVPPTAPAWVDLFGGSSAVRTGLTATILALSVCLLARALSLVQMARGNIWSLRRLLVDCSWLDADGKDECPRFACLCTTAIVGDVESYSSDTMNPC